MWLAFIKFDGGCWPKCCAALAAFRVRAEEEFPVPPATDEAKAAEIKPVSTEFQYSPSKVRSVVRREVMINLDNSLAGTEHALFPRLWLSLAS
jgi:hypothetical protein